MAPRTRTASAAEAAPPESASETTSASAAEAAPPESAGEATSAPGAVRKPVEEWAKQRGVSRPLLAGARVLNAWAFGRELTEEEFVSGIQSTARLQVGDTTRK